MISELSREQFYEKLNSNVLEGSPWIKGTPFSVFTLFDSKTKYFYGEHSTSNFVLTRNAGLFNMTEFVIEGNYEQASEQDITQLKYEVKPIPFGYWWIRLMLPIALTAMSIFLLVMAGSEALVGVSIMWIWLGIPYLFALWRSKKLKNKLEKRFITEFNVILDENKDH